MSQLLTNDDLDAEVGKKFKKGDLQDNIIFSDDARHAAGAAPDDRGGTHDRNQALGLVQE